MKFLSRLILPGMTLFAGLANAAHLKEQAGRDVSIALFSTRRVNAVTIVPMSSSTWTARCESCSHEPLTMPLHLSGAVEIFAGGALRLSDDQSGQQRAATGLWHLRSSGASHEIDAVLTLPSERYVAAVLNAEAAPNEPRESLRAMAVLARTYALNGRHYSAQPGHLATDLCDSTECEAIRLEHIPQVIEDAVQVTAGETLWFRDHRAEVFFSQHCGGTTEDVEAVWPRLRPVSYLRSHADPYCVRRDSSAWHTEVPLATFSSIAHAEGWHLPYHIVGVHISERSRSHRALRIIFTGGDEAGAVVSASSLRFAIGRALGWDKVRSDAYDVALGDGTLVFDGHGHGHGVGLCQTGATEMALETKTAREILQFYFPGTTVRILPDDQGWQESSSGVLAIRTTDELSAVRRMSLEQTWNDGRRRFPSSHAKSATIIFAPTTELFRQLASQPGWDLASTRGETIILQPASVFHGSGQSMRDTLLHEMLHVLVETECNERTPLWLREGLVEVMAGEVTRSRSAMTTAAIDNALEHAASRGESERAHAAATDKVRSLLARYGSSTVRGWLSTGVPAGVA